MVDMHLYDEAILKSFTDTVKWYSKGRNFDKGRAIGSWGRVRFEGGSFVLYTKQVPILCIAPDNTLEFLVDSTTGRGCSNTLSAAMYRAVPFLWHRAGLRRYRIGSTLQAKLNHWDYNEVVKAGPELFVGLTFDLTTGLAINAKPDLSDRVDATVRKDWLRQLRKFKAGMKVRNRLGVMQSVYEKMDAAGTFTNRRPDWDSDEWQTRLYECIRDEKFPSDLLAAFVLSAVSYGWNKHSMPSAGRIDQIVDQVLNQCSIALRTKFGVFTEGK